MSQSLTMPDLTEQVGFSTTERLQAFRYTQGGRTAYLLSLTPLELVSIVRRPSADTPNPGNRMVRPKHAEGFADYVIKQPNWVIPGIILRAPSMFTFEPTSGDAFGIVSYAKTDVVEIRILDGQHRILGFYIAIDKVAAAIDAARSSLHAAERAGGKGSAAYKAAKQTLDAALASQKRLTTERVSIEIQVTDDRVQYEQMFFDIADNALGITASEKVGFDSRSVINRALPLVLNHPLLVGRVDKTINRVGPRNPNLMSARSVTEIIRSLAVGLEGRVGVRTESELNDADLARKTQAFLDMLVSTYTPLMAVSMGQLLPTQLRQTSILGSALMLRILASLYHELTTKHGWTKEAVSRYFEALAPHMAAPVHENTIWIKHAPENSFEVGGTSPSARRQDFAALHRAMLDWAILGPEGAPFVFAAPEPAPEPEVDEDEGVDFAPGHDTKQLQVEIRNEHEEVAQASKTRARATAKG